MGTARGVCARVGTWSRRGVFWIAGICPGLDPPLADSMTGAVGRDCSRRFCPSSPSIGPARLAGRGLAPDLRLFARIALMSMVFSSSISTCPQEAQKRALFGISLWQLLHLRTRPSFKKLLSNFKEPASIIADVCSCPCPQSIACLALNSASGSFVRATVLAADTRLLRRTTEQMAARTQMIAEAMKAWLMAAVKSLAMFVGR